MADDWRETMNKRRNEGRFCDFKILIEEQTFLVHRIVLDTFSEYFRAMFSNEMREAQEGSCKLGGFTARAGKAAIDFLYTGQLELSKDTAPEILKLCHMWQLGQAVKECEDFLGRSIDSSTCISIRKIAVLYDLKDLSQTALKFILDNLDEIQSNDDIMDMNEGDITSVLDGAHDHDPVKLWRFFLRWRGIQSDFTHTNPCKAMLRFPIGRLSVLDFRQHVWDDAHVQSCGSCRQSAGNRMLSCVASSTFRWRDAIFVRELSKQFHHRELLLSTEKVIVENRFKVFTDAEFHRVEKEDLINFVGQIQDECTIEELSAIISWMKHDINRRDVFPELFGSVENLTGRSTSTFLVSLSTNMDLFKPSRFAHEWDSSPWLEIFFLKSLARRYICEEVESRLDQCIVENFKEFSVLNGFKFLDQSDVIKYISSPEMKLDEHVMWGAVKRWTEHDFETRKELFQEVFDSLPLHRFSAKFIRERIHTFSLVQQSIANVNVLMSVLLDKFEKMETMLQKMQAGKQAQGRANDLAKDKPKTHEKYDDLVQVTEEQAKTANHASGDLRSIASNLIKRLDDIERTSSNECRALRFETGNLVKRLDNMGRETENEHSKFVEATSERTEKLSIFTQDIARQRLLRNQFMHAKMVNNMQDQPLTEKRSGRLRSVENPNEAVPLQQNRAQRIKCILDMANGNRNNRKAGFTLRPALESSSHSDCSRRHVKSCKKATESPKRTTEVPREKQNRRQAELLGLHLRSLGETERPKNSYEHS